VGCSFRYLNEDFFLARSSDPEDFDRQLRQWLVTVARPHAHDATMLVPTEVLV
jgi:hypothetical protein